VEAAELIGEESLEKVETEIAAYIQLHPKYEYINPTYSFFLVIVKQHKTQQDYERTTPKT
jgi:hypothetical protein